MESAGAMQVRMQGNMQYVFHDVCHIQIITYFYGWCTVLETLGPWCLPNKQLVVPREKFERQRLKMLFFSPLITTVEEVYLKNYTGCPRTGSPEKKGSLNVYFEEKKSYLK
jgi:hypothetical protein